MKQYNFKNILVTGGAGFIGCNFVHLLFEQESPCTIINLDKLTYAGNKKNLDNLEETAIKKHFFIHGDISNRNLVASILRQYDIDTIIHFAAESHVDRSIEGPSEFIQTNIVGTFSLLEEARKFWLEEKKWDSEKCRFHHISTDEVYGDLKKDDPAFQETTPYAPSSPYSASKASSDHLVRAYYRTYKLPATISNCSNNYGPYQHSEKLIPTVIKCCVEQRPIPVYGKGSNIRDWLFVKDHCQAILEIIKKGKVGETYNIGGNTEKDNLNLVKIICLLCDKKIPKNKAHENLISFVKDRPGHDLRYAIDNSKIKKDLGWEPKYNFEEGLNLTLDHYLKSAF